MVWDVPVDIMSSVFCELSLYQKLQCESVCKDWMQLLRGWHPESTRQLSSAMWGKQLAVYDWSTKSDKIEFSQQPAEKIVLTLKPEMRPTASRAALGRWLTRVSVVVDTLKVFLSPYSDGGWVLPHLLTALYLSRQSALLGPELHLTTGAHRAPHIWKAYLSLHDT